MKVNRKRSWSVIRSLYLGQTVNFKNSLMAVKKIIERAFYDAESPNRSERKWDSFTKQPHD